jgi:hypothetical protein
MKYLKYLFNFKINENNLTKSNIQILEDLCIGHLVYLLDENNYTVDVFGPNDYKDNYYIIFKKTAKEDIEWSNIKDYFEPFIEYLSKRCKINKISTAIIGTGFIDSNNLEDFLKKDIKKFTLLTINISM